MKSQLLQSCRREAPSQPSPRGRCAPQPPQTQRERIPAPWGGLGRGILSAVFLPPTADFFYGQRPLFEPCRLLSSCKAWRWGWWRRQGGKRVFRLASPTATKGEADNRRHGFLCLYQPLTGVSINGLIPQLDIPQAAATLKELRFPSPGLRAKSATLGKRPTNLATL